MRLLAAREVRRLQISASFNERFPVKQVVQSYRSGELKVAEVPAPQAGAGSLLVATRISLISSGTEKQLMDLAKASLAGKGNGAPGPRAARRAQCAARGAEANHREGIRQARYADPARLQHRG